MKRPVEPGTSTSNRARDQIDAQLETGILGWDPADDPDDESLRDLARKFPAKHIALFIYALTGGGAQRRTLTLANAFAACGNRVDLVVVHSQGPLNDQLSRSVRMVGLDRGWGRRHVALGRKLGHRGIRTFLAIVALARYLRETQPDVLLSAASHVNLTAVAAWRLAHIPIALVLRASNHPSGNLEQYPWVQRTVRSYLRWLAKRLYRRADAVIAVSDGVAAEVVRLTGLPDERVTTIYNPVVTPALMEKASMPLDYPWFAPGAPPVILGAGRFTIQKDFRSLIDSFRLLRATRPARLVILGDGPQRKTLQTYANDLGLGQDILMPGHVENPMVWMNKASVFVLSSLWEGLPGVLIEALACGCPVVSTDCPSGPREILEDGTYGPLVPIGDAQALAAAIGAVLDAPPDPKRLRARAASFGRDAAVKRYLEVLEACIHHRAPTRLAWRPPWPFAVTLQSSSDELLDLALSRLAMTRSDLFTAFPGNAAHRLLMAQMMEHFGIDRHRATACYWSILKQADSVCSRCKEVKRCQRWLAARWSDDGPQDFCPNAGLFERIAFAQHDGGDTTPLPTG
jgi:glycosyltransferase involved in cell wall biosynthesis